MRISFGRENRSTSLAGPPSTLTKAIPPSLLRLPIHLTEVPLKVNEAVAPATVDCIAAPPLHPKRELLRVHPALKLTAASDSSTRAPADGISSPPPLPGPPPVGGGGVPPPGVPGVPPVGGGGFRRPAYRECRRWGAGEFRRPAYREYRRWGAGEFRCLVYRDTPLGVPGLPPLVLSPPSPPPPGNQHAREQQDTDARHVALHEKPLCNSLGSVWDPNVSRWRGADDPDEGGNEANPEIVIGLPTAPRMAKSWTAPKRLGPRNCATQETGSPSRARTHDLRINRSASPSERAF